MNMKNAGIKVKAMILDPRTRAALTVMALMSMLVLSCAADQNFSGTISKVFEVIYAIVRVVGGGIFIAGLAQVAMGLLGGAEGQSFNAGLVKVAAGVILFAIPSVLSFIGFDPTTIAAGF